VLHQQIDKHFFAVDKSRGIQQIEPFFVFVGAEEGFFGRLECIQADTGEQFRQRFAG
jgi:hypothetical protein